MTKKVVVAGHICLDITPVFKNSEIHRIDELLAPGKLVNVSKPDVHIGGSVANTGLAMKFLGADVFLVGKVGNDTFGTMIRRELEEYDAAGGIQVQKEDSTSYSVILAIPGLDRIFLHNPGANDTFCAEDIPDVMLKEASLLHFGYPPLMRQMYAEEGEELIKLLKKAKDFGTATSLDMASVDPDGPAGSVNWKKILEKAIPCVDFFVPSAEELCYMLDEARFLEWQKRAGGKDITEILDIDRDIRPLADMCMSLGAKVLVIKCGAQGLYYRTAVRERLEGISPKIGLAAEAWADKEGFEKSYVPECVLSATGAGDTSIAAFLTAMLDGYGIEECMHLAAGTGASCVASYDALGGLVSLNELWEKINAGWKKYD